MTENNLNVILNSSILLSVIIGGCVLLFMYIIRMLKNNNQNNVCVDSLKNANKSSGAADKNKDSSCVTAKTNKKKAIEPKWQGGRGDKQNYTHPWLLTSLKGHTGQILDMDMSNNGKYLASCAEEPDPGGDNQTAVATNNSSTSKLITSNSRNGPSTTTTTTMNNSQLSSPSSNDCNKENSRPSPTTNSATKSSGLSRRQRKNRRREDSSPPVEVKKKSRTRRGNSEQKNKGQQVPSKQFTKLGLKERQLSTFLRTYQLIAEQMLALGFPVESELHPGRAIIFKSPMTAPNQYNPYKASRFDVNAREFIPAHQQQQQQQQTEYVDYSQIKQAWTSSHGEGDADDGTSSSLDSGHGGACSSSSDSSDPTSIEEEAEDSGTGSDHDPSLKCSGAAVSDDSNVGTVSEERQCVRCGHGFFVASDGEYLTQEHCVYHWGKLQRIFSGITAPAQIYSCCHGAADAIGCTIGKLHVWNGVGVGFNGPFDSYVRTRPRKNPPPDGNYGVYALDCEMCYTVGGLELAKVTVVGVDGRLVYDCFVKPEHDIVDYNTRFSGITARDLNRRGLTKTLREVQNDLMGFINADTILLGHGLENDLRALRIMHSTIVDTAVTFPHYNGLPYRRSLKSLTSCYLKRDIQSSLSGHNSCEDARATMELMLWRVRKDFRSILDHYHQHNSTHHQHTNSTSK